MAMPIPFALSFVYTDPNRAIETKIIDIKTPINNIVNPTSLGE